MKKFILGIGLLGILSGCYPSSEGKSDVWKVNNYTCMESVYNKVPIIYSGHELTARKRLYTACMEAKGH